MKGATRSKRTTSNSHQIQSLTEQQTMSRSRKRSTAKSSEVNSSESRSRSIRLKVPWNCLLQDSGWIYLYCHQKLDSKLSRGAPMRRIRDPAADSSHFPRSLKVLTTDFFAMAIDWNAHIMDFSTIVSALRLTVTVNDTFFNAWRKVVIQNRPFGTTPGASCETASKFILGWQSYLVKNEETWVLNDSVLFTARFRHM